MNLSVPISRNDPRRLAALRSVDVHGSAADPLFDALAATAAVVCEVPIAHVVLIDAHRQWILGSVGIPGIRDMTGQCVFSQHLIARNRPLIVPDASRDPRFARHPLVTGPHDMQFYTGMPIRFAPCVSLGSVCVVDHVPRRLARHQLLALRRLAAAAGRGLLSRGSASQATEPHRQAKHHGLTGLPDRIAFESSLADALAQGEASHVLLLDLDRFRVVNDSCGHAAGDRLLRQIGRMIGTYLGPDDRVAHLGADEFGVLLHGSDLQRAHDVAQHICDQLGDFRFVHEGRRLHVGASIGVVPLRAAWTSVTALLQAADASCHAAKDAGRHRVHVWQRTDTAVSMRQTEMQWVGRIEAALDEDRFTLYGQRIEPIGGEDRGLHLEVLLRMREPDGALTLPGAFLPVAERFHLATRIDRWVVRRAFEQMERAARDGLAIEMMAINLSGRSLGDLVFHHDLLASLRHATFDVAALCLEITETAAVTHLSDARRFIDEVRSLGVKVALDDFGAGASSFTYLKSLPVDYLKIDGHFMAHLLDDPIDRAAVRCFSEIAKAKGIKTIAEFVEDQAVRDELQVIGIDLAQGYLLHRPQALDVLLACPGTDDHPVEPGSARPSASRVTEVPFDRPNPNCLDLGERAETLLWADDLSITVGRLHEIIALVGPMRSAIGTYVRAQRRAAGQVSEPLPNLD